MPDDDLDIWPDGLGLEPVSVKISERTPVAPVAEEPVAEEPVVEVPVVEVPVEEPSVEEPVVIETPAAVTEHPSRKRLHPVWIVLIVIGVLLVLFVAASYLFTEQMSPILDRLLYTREELELLRS